VRRVGEAVQQGGQGHHADARRRQFQRERQTIQPAADIHRRGQCHAIKFKGWTRRLHAIHEEAHGGIGQGIIWRQVEARIRQLKRRERRLPLTAQPERRPARHQRLDARTRFKRVAHDQRAVQKLLEVVQHPEHAFFARRRRDLLQRGQPAGERDPQPLRDHLRDQLRIGDGGQLDEVDAVGEVVGERRADRDAEPRLADAARPGDRHQSRILAPQELLRQRDIGLAPDERSQRGGQPRMRLGARGDGRWLGRTCLPSGQHAVDRDALLQALELRRAALDEGDAGHLPRLADDWLRRQRLALTRETAQTRGEIERSATVILADTHHLARRDAHADMQWQRGIAAGVLGADGDERQRRSQRATWRGEDGDDLITTLTEQPPLMLARRGRRQRRELHRQSRRRLITLLLGKGGVIAHVGDEKRALLRRQQLWADLLASSRRGALIARFSCSPGHRSTTSVMIVMR
jgi:hypothetical protein